MGFLPHPEAFAAYDPVVEPWESPKTWQTVADELRRHRSDGLGGLLTEDTVRFATARALVAEGADPAGLRVEWPHPSLRGSRIDLVVGGQPPTALIELKFPREPNLLNAAWTMALGEVLKDLYRLAVAPTDAARIFVYVESTHLNNYMRGAAARYGLDLDREKVTLRPEDAARLPTTASQIIGSELAAHHVTATRHLVLPVDDGLRLSVYFVDRLATLADDAIAVATQDEPAVWIDEPPRRTSTRDGARREILAAVTRILARSGQKTFSPIEVVRELQDAGTTYAETTIRTMVVSHMCVNAPDDAAVTYDDFERLEHGVYRLAP